MLARTFVFAWYEQAHFDSDQAIVGLMGWHAAHFTAFPLYFYGQTYLLGVESWLAAPFLLVFGASVTALKLPLVLLNVACAIALLHLIAHEAHVRAAHALVASLFFVAAPPITASRLVEAQGGNIEPFGYVLGLWMIRGRPFWFGAVLALGVLNREFTIYAAVALVVLGIRDGSLLSRPGGTRVLKSVAAFGTVRFAVIALTPFATDYFEGGKPPSLGTVSAAQAADRLRSLVFVNVPTLLGVREEPLARFNVASALRVGHDWLAPVLLVTLAFILVRLLQLRANAVRSGGTGTPAFAWYLILIGAQSAGAFLLLPPGGDDMLIRYTLLIVFFPIGLVALYIAQERARAPLGAVVAAVTVWAGASVLDHGRLVAEYRRHRPVDDYRVLIRYLEDNGIARARAGYWIAYNLTFRSGGRVVVASTDFVRIREFQRVVATHEDAVLIGEGEPEPSCSSSVRLRRWYICRDTPR